MGARAIGAAAIDASAVTLSGLCLIHCLALPLAVAFLPLAGVVAEAEWVHQAFVAAALPLSAWAILRSGHIKGRAMFVLLAVSGLVLLTTAAFVEALHDFETLLTVVGAILLASAHIWRWRSHTPAHEHPKQ